MTDLQVIEHLTETNTRLQTENYRLSNMVFAVETKLKSRDRSISQYQEDFEKERNKRVVAEARSHLLEEAIENEKNKN